jgi:hypothetical protein
MDVWPRIAPLYDLAARGGTVWGWVTYSWPEFDEPPSRRAYAIAIGTLASFVDFQVEEEGRSELTLGLRGSLDKPAASEANVFHPMELEIRHEPAIGKTVTRLGGAPNRRLGTDLVFDDGIGLGQGPQWGSYIHWLGGEGDFDAGWAYVEVSDHES